MKKSNILGISFQKFKEKDQCVVCGERVHDDENYLASMEGHCHKACVYKTRQTDAKVKQSAGIA